MEESPVFSSPDLVDDTGLQVHKDCPGHVLPGSGLLEEGGERIVSWYLPQNFILLVKVPNLFIYLSYLLKMAFGKCLSSSLPVYQSIV